MNVGETRVGRRRAPEDDTESLVEGDYKKMRNGRWWLWPPGAPSIGTIDPTVHQIVEHEDGTITVSPSILVTYGNDQPVWHGYLQQGVWSRV